MENNWRQKSIENLEKEIWGPPPENATPLMEKVHRLRTIPLEELRPMDLRLLIGQGVGLIFTIPLALEILREDLFVETEFYRGDLLKNVMQVDREFWENHKELDAQLQDLLAPYTMEEKAKFIRRKFGE